MLSKLKTDAFKKLPKNYEGEYLLLCRVSRDVILQM